METRAKQAGGRPRKEEIDVNELRRLIEEGRSLRQIAAQLRRGYGSVHRAAKALDHDGDDPKLSEVIQNPDV